MTLYFIGLGLNDEKDISIKGLETAKRCDSLYLDYYTAVLNCPVEKLEELFGKKIKKVTRQMVENHPDEILEDAKKGRTGFLVAGDPFSATTHIDLMLRARKEGIDIGVIHNASVFTAVAVTGLQLYKFGKTASIPFDEKNFSSETPYNTICQNMATNLHTLLLLDLRPDEGRFMSVNDAIRELLKIEIKRKEKAFTENTLCMGCARLGSKNMIIKFGKAKDILKTDFGKPMHCLIVPSAMHFMEEDAVAMYKTE